MTTGLLHIVGVVALGGTLVWHMHGAGRAFSPGPGEPPSPLALFISVAALVLVGHALRTPIRPWNLTGGLAGLGGSLALFEWARRSIRGRFFSYIFSSDVPTFLHTSGPYRYIRNPFYASYLVAYLSALVMMPDPLSAAVLVVMAVYFWQAARFEERKFLASEQSAEYEEYRRRTGRFLPRLL